jgi:hypothetical protein
MKTFKKVIDKNRLEITYDSNAESPREDSNLGYFITCETGRYSPDRDEVLEEIVDITGHRAKNVDNHMKFIADEFEEDVIAIFPVCKYEHGGVKYSLGLRHGFDYSNCGFYIVTKESLDEIGYEITSGKKLHSMILDEINTFNAYINGDVYYYTLYDEGGNVQDSYCGFYSIDDIASELPDEFKDEDLEDYIV